MFPVGGNWQCLSGYFLKQKMKTFSKKKKKIKQIKENPFEKSIAELLKPKSLQVHAMLVAEVLSALTPFFCCFKYGVSLTIFTLFKTLFFLFYFFFVN